MNRKFLLLVSICSLILLTSCWNRRELNQLGIVIGMGIDQVDGKFLVTTQVVNPSEIAASMGSGGNSPVVVYQETGDTLFEAIRRITTESPRKLYFSHLRLLVFGEQLAKNGIGKSLDLLTRDPELRTDFYITIAKDRKAGDVLKVLTAIEKIPVQQLFESLLSSEKQWAPTLPVTLDQVNSELIEEGKDVKLTGLMIKGPLQAGESLGKYQQSKAETYLQYDEVGVFKNDQLIGWLGTDESKGLNYALGNVKSTIITVPCPEKGVAGIKLIHTKTELKTKVSGSKPKGNIKITADGKLADVYCKTLDLSKPETISQLERKAEKKMKDNILKALHASQKKYKLDPFGFGEAARRDNPDYWHSVKNDWQQIFGKMPVNVEVTVKIHDVGMIKNSPLNFMKD
ncbi:Ger(x)C family spore germination protein [Neobacillus sp. 114]|uniref:Ger(x)C family spore germination protein n=1 Tax=Neobacillus sp. 114 TaxID=3048535 RepID=UPI0024C43C63|nr:Ger(x)C family spore germination protein [Neobacillus sp. 114]